ncbi:hypothetical protein BO71DRAFT_431283 [Aspergillus ellipticus CBS 707.79]|uniref:Uncharacterized protein n=1 Tax=Aspergillus ellipticus CBS 707.79 TaxID=1448320 RepID=A0A319D762_9EURO|nr:hypothetical protein BO71DRAFT_431283 [Aspergillus ellipticus CBS 707.79]
MNEHKDIWSDLDVSDDADTPIQLDLGKGRKGLQKALNLTDPVDWKNWLQSDLVKPYWVEL